MSTLALGLIETRGLVAAIEAADAAAKAAMVTLESAELLGGGIVTLRIRGDLGAVQAAVEAGAQAAKRIGEVLAVRVIPRPVDELERLAPRGEIVKRDRTRGVFQTTSETVRKSHSAPSGASHASIDIRVPRGRSGASHTKKSARSRAVTGRAGQTTPFGEPTAIMTPAPATVASPKAAPATISTGRVSMADLEAMPVVKLRQYARALKNLPIQGRQISMANKTQLLEAIRQIF